MKATDLEKLCLDHFLIGVCDLEVGVKEFAERTGVMPTKGGIHPSQGTANYLVTLGNNIYLEIIGPIPDKEPFGMGLHLNKFTQPQLFWYAATSQCMADTVNQAKSLGFDYLGPIQGERLTAENIKLTWEILELGNHPYAGCMPFIIDWKDTPHPSSTIIPKLELNKFKVSTAADKDLLSSFDALGLTVDVLPGTAELYLELSTPKGIVHYSGFPGFRSVQSGKNYLFGES